MTKLGDLHGVPLCRVWNETVNLEPSMGFGSNMLKASTIDIFETKASNYNKVGCIFLFLPQFALDLDPTGASKE